MRRSLLLLLGFCVVTGLVHAGVTTDVDARLFHRLERPPFTSAPLQDAATVIATPGDGYVSAALVAAGCALLWRRGRRLTAPAFAAGLAAIVAVELVCKLVVSQLRLTAPERILGVVFDSYPSGHMARCTLLAVLAAALWPRLRPALVAWIALVPGSILVLRMHLLSDVGGGALLGGGIALAALRAGRPQLGLRRLRTPSKRRAGPPTRVAQIGDLRPK